MENRNWKNYQFSEVIDLIGGGTPETSESSYWNGDIPWLSVVDFNTSRKYVSDTKKKITEEGLNKPLKIIRLSTGQSKKVCGLN